MYKKTQIVQSSFLFLAVIGDLHQLTLHLILIGKVLFVVLCCFGEGTLGGSGTECEQYYQYSQV